MKLMTLILGMAVSAAAMASESVPQTVPATKIEPAAETVPATKIEPADEAVAVRVGERKLTWGELRRRVEAMAASQGLPPEQAAELAPFAQRMVAEQFVMEAAMKAMAERFGVTLTDAEREAGIKRIEAEAGMPLDDLLKDAPMSREEAMAYFDLSLKVEKVIREQVEAKISVSDADVQKVIAEATQEAADAKTEMEGYVREIAEGKATIEELAKAHSPIPEAIEFPVDQVPPAVAKALTELPVGEVSPLLEAAGVLALFKVLERNAAAADPKAAIEAVAGRLAAGEDFAAVAKAESDCPSGAEGGDLGEFGRGMMVPEFEKAAFEQPVGEVGAPFETQFGWHIVKVTARDDESGKVTASHILKMAKPATVKAVALLKPCVTELPEAEAVREALRAEALAEAQAKFMAEQKTLAGEPVFDPALAPEPEAFGLSGEEGLCPDGTCESDPSGTEAAE